MASCKFVTYSAAGKDTCQEIACMDEEKMNKGITIVLKTWKDVCDEKNVQPPLLILDSFKMNQVESIVNWIQVKGTEVIHIPAQCTYLYPPVHMGITKP